MRFIRYLLFSDWRVPTLLGVIIAIFLLLFYLDYTRTVDIGDREVIGFIRYRNNIVQRRFSDQVIWSNLQNESPLTDEDTIRSANLSDAEIHLNDGTVIRIDENSMFFLDLSGGRPTINFQGGTLEIARGTNGNGEASDLLIQTAQGELSVADSDLRLEAGEAGVNVQVNRGEARFESNGETHTVGQFERAQIDSSGVSVREVNLRLRSPAHQQLIAGTGNQIRVDFSWQIAGDYRPITFELARQRSFSHIDRSSTVNATGTTVALAPGTYFWRIRGRNQSTGRTEESEIRKLIVAQNSNLALVAPANGAEVTYVEQSPPVHFRWTASDLAGSYTFRLATDPALNTVVREETTSTTALAVSNLAPGVYYWRVTTRPSIEGVSPVASPVFRFSLGQRSSYAPPVALRPVGETFAQPAIATSGIAFDWQGASEFQSFDLQVSSDPGFTAIVIERTVSNRSSYLSREALANGTYYWRVRGRSASGQTSAYSAPRSFQVAGGPRTAREDADGRDAREGTDQQDADRGDTTRDTTRDQRDQNRTDQQRDDRVPLEEVRPDDIEFISPEEIYKP
ncbi:MAG: FecR domain-containing protein [Spirochaetales bacterium]|nr:FecR domain-containing protein [Leptospiraceae bacterium]MCP5482350.1 FecR domain-containing protein [Spirochaetales bacterium]MCP5484211.1 FecR domain-containing protein [Spirochaetales bacterium]